MLKKRAGLRISNRKLMYSMLAFVLVGITTMTIAYATLSTTLKITGSAEFQEASWDFVITKQRIPDYLEIPNKFIKNDNTLIVGDAKVLKEPTITGTQISDFQVSIKKIGDEIGQYYTITNVGDVPARLESIIYDDWEITSNNQEDVELVNDNFRFYTNLFYVEIEDGEIIADGSIIDIGDLLCPGASFGIAIITGYDSNAPRVPYSGLTISDLGVSFNFIAADQNLCDGKLSTEVD